MVKNNERFERTFIKFEDYNVRGEGRSWENNMRFKCCNLGS
ncbi:MAG: hypothetical protein BAJALOKI2v1_820012 [Promethearchaeota archaeon]|nr:MAG: hypothetical protein BAJALOKI2v1_820012 [Candidatus Lokiarchaeota archaeon]